MAYYQNNVAATVSLLQIMDSYGCTRFVYSSSATVYGIPPHIPIPETSPLQAESCYGRTKIVSEGVLYDLCLCTSRRLHAVSTIHESRRPQPARTHGARSRSDISSAAFLRILHPSEHSQYHSPAGAHPSGLIGEDPRGRPGNLLPLLSQMAIGRVKDPVLKVFGNDYPTRCARPPRPFAPC